MGKKRNKHFYRGDGAIITSRVGLHKDQTQLVDSKGEAKR